MNIRDRIHAMREAHVAKVQVRAEQRYRDEWGISLTRDQEIAHVNAKYAAQQDRRAMEARERQRSEGKAPVNRIGTAHVRDGQLHMSGWQFEGRESQEIESGADIKDATGWTAQELADMAQQEFAVNADYRHEVMNGTRNDPQPEPEVGE